MASPHDETRRDSVSVDWSAARLRPSTVGTEVTAYLEKLITSGQVRPGEKLPPERELSERLGVSRTSVRHAMAELTLKGLTDRKPGRGTVVLRPNPRVGELLAAMPETKRHMVHVMDLRRVIEPSITAQAAERATEADLRGLQRILDTSTPDLDPAESARLDEEFHKAIARATQNPLLAALIELVRTWLAGVRRESHATRAGRLASIEGHLLILEALQAGSPTAAMSAMADHIESIGRVIADG